LNAKPKVGVLMTLLELYRNAHPEMPAKFGEMWRGFIADAVGDAAELHFSEVAHTSAEVAAEVTACEEAGCDLLVVLPMAYAASGSARDALAATPLPLLVLSTTRDATLPHDMSGDHIMANHAMHGVQDLANVLARAGRDFELVAGHHADSAFRERLRAVVKAAAGAAFLREGTAGRIGEPFEGMLDFSFDPEESNEHLGFEVEGVDPAELAGFAGAVTDDEAARMAEWARGRFELGADLTDDELLTSARWSLGLENLVEAKGLGAFSMNFLALAAVGAGTMPFLGASRLMSRGVGYAGEGDVLTAALGAAVARVAAGEATFTEMFCPDYARDEVLLSHMGECNFELANASRPVKLVAKPFNYGECARPAVPVFQLRPGTVTLASLTEWPDESFRIVAARCEIIDAPEHANLQSPHSRISFGRALGGFLEDYSRAGGTHHLALGYGDLVREFRSLARLCRIGFVEV